MRIRRAITLMAMMCFGVPLPIQATQDHSHVLAGVDSVYANVEVIWDERIPTLTETQFRQQVTDAFELGLLRAGLAVSPSSISFVSCSVILTYVSVHSLVIRAERVEFSEMVHDRDTAEIRWATLWSEAAVVTAGETKFEGKSTGRWCAEQFEIEWRKANN